MKSTRNGDRMQPHIEASIALGDVIRIIKSVRDQYVPEVFPESSLLADYICGEIIAGVKEAAGAARTKLEGGDS